MLLLPDERRGLGDGVIQLLDGCLHTTEKYKKKEAPRGVIVELRCETCDDTRLPGKIC